MSLTAMDIYQLLPQTNCGDCGTPTCLAFAMQLANKQASLDDCPHASEEAQNELASASQPPIKLVEIGAGEDAVEVGNETVMFRHEETFHHPCGVACRITDDLDDDELDEKIEQAIEETATRLQASLQSQAQLALKFLAGTDGAASTAHAALRADLETVGGGEPFPSETLQGLNTVLTKTSKFFSQNARAGEKGHALVYGVGKKLGVKFRPWGAVKTARFLGRAAGGLAIAASIWDIWNQQQQERKEAEDEKALQKARVSLRSAFQMLASDTVDQTGAAFDRYLHSTYDAALDFVDGEIGVLIDEQAGSSEVLSSLGELGQQLHELLREIRGADVSLGHGQPPVVESASAES